MASPESITTGIKDITFDVIPIEFTDTFEDAHIDTVINDIKFYVCPSDIVPEVVGIERLSFSDNKTIKITFNYDLECELDNLKESLVLKNLIDEEWEIATVAEEGNILTIKTVNEMLDAQDMILYYSESTSYYLAFRIDDSCLHYYGSALELTIDGLPPIGYETENLITSITDATFNIIDVDYVDAFNKENITAGIADISFVVTKVRG